MSKTKVSPQEEAIKACFSARVPVMMVSAPGMGKSAFVRGLAKEMGYDLITLVGSRMDPTDVSGLPKSVTIEDSKGKSVEVTSYLANSWQVHIMQKKKVLLFFDEFSNTPPSTRSSLLTLLQEREFPNGDVMPEETLVIGAMNPPEEAADGFELDLPTKNRMFFIAWEPTVKEWVDGYMNNWGEPEMVSEDEWTWRSRIARFISENGVYLHSVPADNESVPKAFARTPSLESVYRSAWPSRRSWHNAGRALASIGLENINTQDMILEGLVGAKATEALREWIRKNETIRPQDAIEKPESIQWDMLSVDDMNAVLRNVLAITEKSNVKKVVKMFSVIADTGRLSQASAYMGQLGDIVLQFKDRELNRDWFKLTEQYANVANNA